MYRDNYLFIFQIVHYWASKGTHVPMANNFFSQRKVKGKNRQTPEEDIE